MRRPNMTLERPARFAETRTGPRRSSREAHLMVDPDAPPMAERPHGSTRDSAASAGASPPVPPETLQAIIRDLVADDTLAREMQVSPPRALRKIPYLSDLDRRRLSDVKPEVLESLADAASRYARAAKEAARGVPLPVPDPRQADRFGREWFEQHGGRPGGRRGGGMPGDIAGFVPGGYGGLGRGWFGGRNFPGGPSGRPGGRGGPPGGGGGGGWSPGNYGGLGRGRLSGLGVPGAQFGPSFGGQPMDPQGGPGTSDYGLDADIGFLDELNGRLGTDPLINARAWHRLHPGQGAMDDPKGSQPKSGGEGTGEAQQGQRPLSPHEKGVFIGGAALVGAGVGFVASAGVGMPSPLIALDGAVMAGMAGWAIASWSDPETVRRWLPNPFGFMPAPDDPDGGGAGPRGHANIVTEAYGRSAATQAAVFMPAPDDPDGDGPRLSDDRSHRSSLLRPDMMPAPDDSGGGPGPWASVYKPNPDDPDAAPTPRSRASTALRDVARSVTRVLESQRR